MNLRNLHVVFMDCQTTGASPATGELLEVAWLTGSASMVEEMHGVLMADVHVPGRIEDLTGISNELVAEKGQPAQDVLAEFCAQAASAHCAVIHYAQFETPFLHQWAGGKFPLDILCTYQIARRVLPNFPTRGVRGLAAYFGLPLAELKRAEHHVLATQKIWHGLVEALEQQGIAELNQLHELLASKAPAKKSKRFDYPMERLARLQLPDVPGIYRMKNRTGDILYVGKATSLKSRVNSYFRGQKNRDKRKTEMLMQVCDIEVTACATPLEAAILETDEIKKWNPPFNVSLKEGRRQLCYFSRHLDSVSLTYSAEHPIGPFVGTSVMDPLRLLCASVAAGGPVDPLVFYTPVEVELIAQGFAIFCAKHSLSPADFVPRKMLALGLWLVRGERAVVVEELDEVEVEAELTAEDVAEKFERVLLRAGRAYERSRRLTRLLNSNVHFSEGDVQRSLLVRGGRFVAQESRPADWCALGIADYDRMRVLLTELERCRGQVVRS